MKNNESFERMYKFCEVCQKRRPHIIETSVTTCEVCHETRDEDLDDLFCEIDEAME